MKEYYWTIAVSTILAVLGLVFWIAALIFILFVFGFGGDAQPNGKKRPKIVIIGELPAKPLELRQSA